MTEFNGKLAYTILTGIAHERLAATAGEKKAARTLAKRLKSFGLVPVTEPFRMRTYVNDDAWLEVLEPYKKRYPAAALGLSGSTPRSGVVAPFQYIEHANDRWIDGCDGKIVLTSAAPLGYERLEELIARRVKAIVFVGPPHKLHNRKAMREAVRTKVGTVPSLDLVFEDALEIVKRRASKVRVFLKQQEKEGTSQNVLADIPGRRRPDEIIVLTAHYDGISKSVGGHDNASGAAIVTALAKALADEPLARTVRIVLCGGEEFGLHGSQNYVKKHKKELEKVVLCINCDIAGTIFGQDSCFVTGPDTLQHYLECMGKEEGMSYQVSTAVYSSDNVSFSEHGVPAASITRGGGYVCEVHSSADGIEDIDADHLAITGSFILKFLRRVANAIEFPFKREIPDKLKKDIDKYIERMHGRHFKPRYKKRPAARPTRKPARRAKARK